VTDDPVQSFNSLAAPFVVTGNIFRFRVYETVLESFKLALRKLPDIARVSANWLRGFTTHFVLENTL
jgi:hypothetical protein